MIDKRASNRANLACERVRVLRKTRTDFHIYIAFGATSKYTEVVYVEQKKQSSSDETTSLRHSMTGS